MSESPDTTKLDLIQYIIDLDDPIKLAQVRAFLQRATVSSMEDQGVSYRFATYKELQSRKVDLQVLKEEQGYTATSTKELSAIAEEANIEESIEHLLADLKAMG